MQESEVPTWCQILVREKGNYATVYVTPAFVPEGSQLVPSHSARTRAPILCPPVDAVSDVAAALPSATALPAAAVTTRFWSTTFSTSTKYPAFAALSVGSVHVTAPVAPRVVNSVPLLSRSGLTVKLAAFATTFR